MAQKTKPVARKAVKKAKRTPRKSAEYMHLADTVAKLERCMSKFGMDVLEAREVRMRVEAVESKLGSLTERLEITTNAATLNRLEKAGNANSTAIEKLDKRLGGAEGVVRAPVGVAFAELERRTVLLENTGAGTDGLLRSMARRITAIEGLLGGQFALTSRIADIESIIDEKTRIERPTVSARIEALEGRVLDLQKHANVKSMHTENATVEPSAQYPRIVSWRSVWQVFANESSSFPLIQTPHDRERIAKGLRGVLQLCGVVVTD